MHFLFSIFPPSHSIGIGASCPSSPSKSSSGGPSSTTGLVLFLETGLRGSTLITKDINSKNR